MICVCKVKEKLSSFFQLRKKSSNKKLLQLHNFWESQKSLATRKDNPNKTLSRILSTEGKPQEPSMTQILHKSFRS